MGGGYIPWSVSKIFLFLLFYQALCPMLNHLSRRLHTRLRHLLRLLTVWFDFLPFLASTSFPGNTVYCILVVHYTFILRYQIFYLLLGISHLPTDRYQIYLYPGNSQCTAIYIYHHMYNPYNHTIWLKQIPETSAANHDWNSLYIVPPQDWKLSDPETERTAFSNWAWSFQ